MIKFLIASTTDLNQTLIYFTDLDIIEATQKYFPRSTHYPLSNVQLTDEGIRQHLREMVHAYRTEAPTMTFVTSHKIPLERVEFKVEDKRLSYLSDGPFVYLDYFPTLPKGSSVTYSDRNMKVFYDDFYPDFGLNAYFVPHGGPNKISLGKDIIDRHYPISFVGRIHTPEPAGDFVDFVKGSDPIFIKIIREAIDRSYHEGTEIYCSYRQSCIDNGFSSKRAIPIDSLQEVLIAMQGWLETTKRIRMLQSLRGLPIHIFGEVSDAVKARLDPNFKYYGPINGQQVLDVMANSQISLNPVSVFPSGSHERVWFAMANRSVIYADYTDFMAETLTDNESILFHDYKDEDKAAERLQTLLNSPNDLQQIADNAIPIYEKNHTWIKRLEDLFKQMPETKDYMV